MGSNYFKTTGKPSQKAALDSQLVPSKKKKIWNSVCVESLTAEKIRGQMNACLSHPPLVSKI